MRVVSGVAKGRRLKAPSGGRIRPTADRVKETLFDIIGERVLNARVLDLFAGTGSLGIEALSRGARFVLFVDAAREAVKLIGDNLVRTAMEERAETWRSDALAAVARLKKEGRHFDIVLLDPPYGYDHIGGILRQLQQANLFSRRSLMVVEHHKRTEIPNRVDSMERIDQRRFGDTMISFYQEKVSP
jgi:16S rRNA (guanine966-N2)-methyltransferase